MGDACLSSPPPVTGLLPPGTAAASAYVEDIARHQAGAFVSGIAPIASICRVSAAAAQLLAIPRAALYQRASGEQQLMGRVT